MEVTFADLGKEVLLEARIPCERGRHGGLIGASETAGRRCSLCTIFDLISFSGRDCHEETKDKKKQERKEGRRE
jgi:hypothetical protein